MNFLRDLIMTHSLEQMAFLSAEIEAKEKHREQ